MSFSFRLSLILWAGIFCTGLSLAGCSVSTQEPAFSGFLTDYSKLALSPKHSGALVYVNAAKRVSLYKMITLDPIQVYLADGTRLPSTPGSREQQLARQLNDEITNVLSDSYPVVENSGFGVLRARIAITNVKHSDSPFSSLLSKNMFGFDLTGSSAEMELLDTQTGETVITIVDTEHGRPYRRPKNTFAYKDARDILRSWAVVLLDVLNDARGLHITNDFRSIGRQISQD